MPQQPLGRAEAEAIKALVDEVTIILGYVPEDHELQILTLAFTKGYSAGTQDTWMNFKGGTKPAKKKN